jgi:hypothetical protein
MVQFIFRHSDYHKNWYISWGQVNQKLRKEWRGKSRLAEIDKTEIQRTASTHLDDLDSALLLLSRISDLYYRLSEKQRATLLQIIAKRIILNLEGEIIDHELNSPFMYLNTLHNDMQIGKNQTVGSEKVRVGAPRKNPKGFFCFNQSLVMLSPARAKHLDITVKLSDDRKVPDSALSYPRSVQAAKTGVRPVPAG